MAPCCAAICSISKIIRLIDSCEMDGEAGLAEAGGVDDVAVGAGVEVGAEVGTGAVGDADNAAAIRDFNEEEGLVALKGERQTVMRCPDLPQFKHMCSFNLSRTAVRLQVGW